MLNSFFNRLRYVEDIVIDGRKRHQIEWMNFMNQQQAVQLRKSNGEEWIRHEPLVLIVEEEENKDEEMVEAMMEQALMSSQNIEII